MLIAFHKPYGVLSQFTTEVPGQRTLAEFGFPKGVYPVGRLDADSEGLLLLSDEPEWNERLLHPRHAHGREYWVQIERIPTLEALKKLERGVVIQGRRGLPCRAWILDPQPDVEDELVGRAYSRAGALHRSTARGYARSIIRIHPRAPPIRFRKAVPTCWIALELVEGKNRQVRRMTACVGHPTLRLIRVRIGNFELAALPCGKGRILTPAERRLAGG